MANYGYFIIIMILYISIFLFNYIALKMNKIKTMNRIVHIWLFTITIQIIFDVIIEFKYHGYWYFDKGVDWHGLPAHLFLIPPVNVMVISWFPFKTNLFKQTIYILCWTLVVVFYEWVTILPEPWGFFHFGWWKLWYDLIIVPVLILILVGFYKWVIKLELKICNADERA
ncbi:hypothetical protein [Bacillus marasmi]|uniref:hypothetical protein n=1 Tax=Bacillus marasmi TaxID=1926279 RepID=UPI001FEAF1AA|nr:hypothetical protein [Bacillus marasmi]